MHFMASITIKNLPDPLYKKLKARAKQNSRSVNGEIIQMLKKELALEPRDVEKILADARAIRSLAKGALSEEEVRRAIQEGRP